MRAQGGARLFFGSRVPALFVISAPLQKFTFAYSAVALLPARPIILRIYRTLQTITTTTHAIHLYHHNSSTISHNTSDSFSITITIYPLDPMSATKPLI